MRFFKKIQDWILKSERIRKWILRFFTRQINPRSFGSWCVKGTEESSLQSACFEKLIFEHAFNVRKIKRIAKSDDLDPRRWEDIRGIVALEIGSKSFRTFEKQAPCPIITSTDCGISRSEFEPVPCKPPQNAREKRVRGPFFLFLFLCILLLFLLSCNILVN